MHALRRVSGSGAPNNVQNCHLDKTNMDKTSQHRRYIYVYRWEKNSQGPKCEQNAKQAEMENLGETAPLMCA